MKLDREKLLELAAIEYAVEAHIRKKTLRAKGEAAALASVVANTTGLRGDALRALAGETE